MWTAPIETLQQQSTLHRSCPETLQRSAITNWATVPSSKQDLLHPVLGSPQSAESWPSSLFSSRWSEASVRPPPGTRTTPHRQKSPSDRRETWWSWAYLRGRGARETNSQRPQLGATVGEVDSCCLNCCHSCLNNSDSCMHWPRPLFGPKLDSLEQSRRISNLPCSSCAATGELHKFCSYIWTGINLFIIIVLKVSCPVKL